MKDQQLNPNELWLIHGKYYDLSGFMKIHPGGKRLLELCKGTDCTAVFESSHLHSRIPEAMMNKYYVGNAENYTSEFSWGKNDFYPVLKQRVADYFATKAKQKGAKPSDFRNFHHGTLPFKLRLLLIFAIFLLVSYGAVFQGYILCALIWGPFAFALGGYGHEAMHGGVFKSVFLNRALALITLDLLSLSSFVFSAMHIPLHHVYTNVQSKDPDIEVHFPLIRERDKQPRMFFHRFQHLYCWIIYALTFPVSTIMDIISVFKGQWFGSWGKMKRPCLLEWLHLISFKAIAVFLWGVLPYILLPLEQALIVQTLMIGFTGIIVQATFACSHQNKLAMNLEGRVSTQKNDWGAAQLETTVNFHHGHWLPVTFFGGLGYQIEHHLFPTLSYSALPEIVPIVKKTCAEFGVPYFYVGNGFQAYKEHFHFLKKMGKRSRLIESNQIVEELKP